jgi:hypothetical protein
MSGTDDIDAALAAMRQSATKGRGRKSAPYQWLAARHDALVAAFAEEPPSWPALAAFLAERGIMNADGKPPTAEGLRKVWLRVRQAAEKPPSSEPRPQAKPARDAAERSPPDDEPDNEPPRPRIPLSRPKG